MSPPHESVVQPPRDICTPSWTQDFLERFRHHLALKIIAVSAFMAVFFNGYFSALEDAQQRAYEMPLLALDHWLPFEPWAIVPYLSLWFYVGIVPGLMLNWRSISLYGVWATVLCALGLTIFRLWPTEVPIRLPPDVQAWGFSLLKGLDAPANACPSLHVAGTVLTALWLHRLLGWITAPVGLKMLNALWALAIIWSTMATRQHVALDVLGGVCLGLAVSIPSLWLHPNLGRYRA